MWDVIDRARRGDDRAAEELVRRFSGTVRAVIHRDLTARDRRRVSADDVVQETFLSVFANLAQVEYVNERAFAGWIRRVAEREVAMVRRRHAAQCRDVARQARLATEFEIAGDATTPTAAAHRSETRITMRAAIERLPSPDRQVVELHSIHGLTFPAVADRLGLSGDSTARYVFSRALRRLERLLR